MKNRQPIANLKITSLPILFVYNDTLFSAHFWLFLEPLLFKKEWQARIYDNTIFPLTSDVDFESGFCGIIVFCGYVCFINVVKIFITEKFVFWLQLWPNVVTFVTKCYYICDKMFLHLWLLLHLWQVITFVPSADHVFLGCPLSLFFSPIFKLKYLLIRKIISTN